MGISQKQVGLSTSMGEGTTASGWVSKLWVELLLLEDYGTTVIGVFNETKETPNPETFSYQNTAFVIGSYG